MTMNRRTCDIHCCVLLLLLLLFGLFNLCNVSIQIRVSIDLFYILFVYPLHRGSIFCLLLVLFGSMS